MKSKYLKILGVPIDSSATAYHRVVQPLQALKSAGHSVDFLGDPEIQAAQYAEADLHYVQCLYAPGAYQFYAQQKELGKKLIVDFDDDYFNIPPDSPEQTEIIDAQTGEIHIFSPELRILWVKLFLSLADVLVVTTPALARLYRPFAKKIVVIPNCIVPEMARDVPKSVSEKVRILWTGSASHLPDLEILRQPLTRLVESHGDRIELHFQGPLPFREIFPNLPFQDHPGVSFADYLNTIQAIDADVCLLPLKPNQFNEGKSNLKFLQMTLLEAACVASNFGPYQCITHGLEGLLSDNENEWYSNLVLLVEDAVLRSKLVKRAREFAYQLYSLDHNLPKWANLIDKL